MPQSRLVRGPSDTPPQPGLSPPRAQPFKPKAHLLVSLRVPVPYPHQPMTTHISPCPPRRELQGCGDLVLSSSDSPSLEQSLALQVHDDSWGELTILTARNPLGCVSVAKEPGKLGSAWRYVLPCFWKLPIPPLASRAPGNSLQGDVFSQNCLWHHFNSPHPLPPEGVRKEGAKLQENKPFRKRREA